MRATEFITEEAKAAKYNGLSMKYAFNNSALILKAFEPATKNPLAYVKFVKEDKELYPQDLWVNDEYRSKGIAKSMYDYLKSEGYVINRSHDQTKAGSGFWDKHRGEDEYVWEDEKLDELFQPGKDWKWSFQGSEEAVAVFHVGDVPYMFHAYGSDGQWEVEFKRHGSKLDRMQKFGLTGTGNSAEVMSTVVDIMRAFLDKYKDKIEVLTFSAKEDSRQGLYAKMAKRLLPDWTLTQNAEHFTLVAPKPEVEEDTTGWRWTGDEEFRHIDEGVLDWAKKGIAGAAIGAAALSPQIATAKSQPTHAVQKPAVVQKQAPQTFNTLSMNNTDAEVLLQKAAKKAGMKGVELAQFLAQARHESADFSRMKERGGPEYFKKMYDPAHAPRTAKILGNKHVGDGERYHGRGFFQITGRDNYRMAGDALDLPLLQKPELAARPDVAAKIAVWYWNTRVKPHVQNFNDTVAVTKKINPAAKGLADRQENFIDYKRII